MNERGIFCGICGRQADPLHRVNTDRGIRWLCKDCMAKLRQIKKEKAWKTPTA